VVNCTKISIDPNIGQKIFELDISFLEIRIMYTISMTSFDFLKHSLGLISQNLLLVECAKIQNFIRHDMTHAAISLIYVDLNDTSDHI